MKLNIELGKKIFKILGLNAEMVFKLLKQHGLLYCCKEEDCFNPHYGNGFCRKHYARDQYRSKAEAQYRKKLENWKSRFEKE